MDFELGRWTGMLKQMLGKAVAHEGNDPVWQRGFFDHVLRNPARAGLVSSAHAWPYAGEIIYIDRV